MKQLLRNDHIFQSILFRHHKQRSLAAQAPTPHKMNRFNVRPPRPLYAEQILMVSVFHLRAEETCAWLPELAWLSRASDAGADSLIMRNLCEFRGGVGWGVPCCAGFK